MAKPTSSTHSTALAGLRAKESLYDELVERLATCEEQLAATRRELRETRRAAARDGIDPEWRAIANAVTGALRPYSLFREQRIVDGRIVVETRVPGATLHKATAALNAYARQVAIESYREHGIPVLEDERRRADTEEREAA